MREFNVLFRWGWTFLIVVTLGLTGCDGDDGAAGAAGAAGQAGTDGTACWDLNGNGVGDPEEDIDGDLDFDADDCAADADPVAAAVEAAKPESCATCHDGVGVEKHQSVYDKYVDASALTLTLNSVSSVLVAPGDYTVTLNVSITDNGLPYVDGAGLPGLNQWRFYMVRWDIGAQQYLQGNQRLRTVNPGALPGDYVVTQTGMPFAPELSNAHVYGYIARGVLVEHVGGTGAEFAVDAHVHLYDDVANAALAFGDAQATDPDAYVSAANVGGCQKCHGTPYLKHGFRDPIVAGLPDFASCKSCHYDDRSGGHEDWQYMVDDPVNWATAGLPEPEVEARYAYNASIMNDVHMAHAMEFPYPQSMSNCNTCHENKLAQILTDSNFKPETCKSCHAVQGIDAWPGETYAQSHRAPPLEYLWEQVGFLDLHRTVLASATPDCSTTCHKVGGLAPPFSAFHTGYDSSIYDATGTKYADLKTVAIDLVTWDAMANTLKIDFSANDPAIVPEVLVSFYGWDSKNFIVPSHARDGSERCPSRRGNGCRFEWEPGSTNPLFSDFAEINPGEWTVTANLAEFQAAETDDILILIADKVVKNAEITITPTLTLAGERVVLKAVDQTVGLTDGLEVPDYFKGANAVVSIAKCNACHDALASSFHDGSGRGGDGIEVCKNCHNPTFPGSHVEMASRSIDSYVHAIHSFQDFDIGDSFDTASDPFDPVFAKRYDQHTKHVFPNFTIRNCEACHLTPEEAANGAVVYNVPDQSKSMPGVLSASDTVDTWYDLVDGLAVENTNGRNIGTVPETVTGPASRACGGCHRARLIRDDAAGDLASFNAHTEAFGTYVENDVRDDQGSELDDEFLFGIIDKIMGMFQ